MRTMRLALLALLTAALLAPSAQAARKPVKLSSAVFTDRDSDGSVDGVSVRFSGSLRGKPRASDFRIAGYTVRSARRSGRKVALALAERAACDAGGRPVVTYRGRSLRDGRGRRLRRFRADLERKDRRAPRMTCAVTSDGNGDGRVDAVVLTYSKRVRSRASSGGTVPFSVAGRRVLAAGGARGRNVTLTLAEGSRPDTDLRPAITYKRPSRRNRRYAVSARGGQAFSGTFKAVRDRVAPLLLAAATRDGDGDGLLDGVGTSWSEPVAAGAAAFAVAGTRITRASAGGGAVELGLAEGPHGSGARPLLALRGTLADSSGNAARRQAVVPRDGAAPVLRGARTADVEGTPGRVDRLRLTFSEPVSHPADGDGSYPFAATGYGLRGAGSAAGAGLDLLLTERSSPDTGARPAVAYVRGRGAPVRDAAGNEARTGGPSAAADGVAPRLLSATTRDENSDGRLDRVGFAFSEPVSHPAEAGGSFAVGGLAVSSALAASGANVDVALTPAGAPNTGQRPPASYTPDGVADVADASGNRAAASSVLAAADGAPPVLVGASTGDSAPANARIDRVDAELSEPVSAAADGAGPYSFDAAGRTISSVGAASGSGVSVRLAEAADPDTGDAPSLTYTGAGTAIRDAAGLELARRPYTGLTRDAVVPSILAAHTRDQDSDGRLDRVLLGSSEELAGSTSTAPFAVAGRSLTGVSLGQSGAELRFEEAAAPDTADRPAAGYSPGDLTDVAQGPGDTASPVPAASFAQAGDGAGPVMIGAETVDDNEDGTVDAVRSRFSEPVAHPLDDSAPFGIDVEGRTEREISAPEGSVGDQLTTEINPASSPDGGLRPDVAVTTPTATTDRVRDRATPANDAPAQSFAGTTDGVRPRLVGAELGESVNGNCERAPLEGIDGRVDCAVGRFSEPVNQPADTSSPFSYSLDNGFSLEAGGVPAVNGSPAVTLPLQPGAAPNRDQGADLTVIAAPDGPVDVNGNATLPDTVGAERACADSTHEPNDSRPDALPDLPLLEPSLERRCAFDDDWFRFEAGAGGELKAAARPSPTLDAELRLVNGAGTTVGSALTRSAGQVEELEATGLTPGADYWLQVSAPDATDAGHREGTYCLSVSNTDDDPSCGPNAGELVFTEVMAEGSAAGRFVELKNVSDFPLDLTGVALKLDTAQGSCDVTTASGSTVIQPGDYAAISGPAGSAPFRCSALDGLTLTAPLKVKAGDSLIDETDLSSATSSGLAAGHSLEVRSGAETAVQNGDVARNWCRTWTAHTRGAPGDGCDEYRVNEVLFDPVASGGDGYRDGPSLRSWATCPPAPTPGCWAAGSCAASTVRAEPARRTSRSRRRPARGPTGPSWWATAWTAPAPPART